MSLGTVILPAKYIDIEIGAQICMKLKNIYFHDVIWQKSYKDVGAKFTALKKIVRCLYKDKSEIEFLKELRKYSEEDIKNAFSIG